MAIADVVGILLSSSLDQARISKKRPDKPAEFYANVAFPASAFAAFAEVMQASNPNWQSLVNGIVLNAKQEKPYAGIPDDALVVRFRSQFAPAMYDANATVLTATPENAPHVRQTFYAGRYVRIDSTCWPWLYAGRQGLSWNLNGIMACEGGDPRQAPSASNLDAYVAQAQNGHVPQAAHTQYAQQYQPPAAQANVQYAQQYQPPAPAQQQHVNLGADPFQQPAQRAQVAFQQPAQQSAPAQQAQPSNAAQQATPNPFFS